MRNDNFNLVAILSAHVVDDQLQVSIVCVERSDVPLARRLVISAKVESKGVHVERSDKRPVISLIFVRIETMEDQGQRTTACTCAHISVDTIFAPRQKTDNLDTCVNPIAGMRYTELFF